MRFPAFIIALALAAAANALVFTSESGDWGAYFHNGYLLVVSYDGSTIYNGPATAFAKSWSGRCFAYAVGSRVYFRSPRISIEVDLGGGPVVQLAVPESCDYVVASNGTRVFRVWGDKVEVYHARADGVFPTGWFEENVLRYFDGRREEFKRPVAAVATSPSRSVVVGLVKRDKPLVYLNDTGPYVQYYAPVVGLDQRGGIYVAEGEKVISPLGEVDVGCTPIGITSGFDGDLIVAVSCFDKTLLLYKGGRTLVYGDAAVSSNGRTLWVYSGGTLRRFDLVKYVVNATDRLVVNYGGVKLVAFPGPSLLPNLTAVDPRRISETEWAVGGAVLSYPRPVYEIAVVGKSILVVEGVVVRAVGAKILGAAGDRVVVERGSNVTAVAPLESVARVNAPFLDFTYATLAGFLINGELVPGSEVTVRALNDVEVVACYKPSLQREYQVREDVKYVVFNYYVVGSRRSDLLCPNGTVMPQYRTAYLVTVSPYGVRAWVLAGEKFVVPFKPLEGPDYKFTPRAVVVNKVPYNATELSIVGPTRVEVVGDWQYLVVFDKYSGNRSVWFKEGARVKVNVTVPDSPCYAYAVAKISPSAEFVVNKPTSVKVEFNRFLKVWIDGFYQAVSPGVQLKSIYEPSMFKFGIPWLVEFFIGFQSPDGEFTDVVTTCGRYKAVYIPFFPLYIGVGLAAFFAYWTRRRKKVVV